MTFIYLLIYLFYAYKKQNTATLSISQNMSVAFKLAIIFANQ